MKYVIKMFEEYYFRDAGDCVEELYDLEQATIFTSKKSAKEAIHTLAGMGDYCDILKFDDIIEDFRKWKDAGMVRRTLHKVDESKSKKYDGEGLEEVIEHRIWAFNNPQSRYEDAKTWPDVGHFLENFYDTEFYSNHDYTERYMSFQIKLHKQKSVFSKFKEEMEKLLPHVTYVDEDGEGYKIFRVFEHTLGEHGIYSFYYDESQDFHKIVKTTYGSDRDTFKGTLKQCFEKLKKYHYKENEQEEREWDDYDE